MRGMWDPGEGAALDALLAGLVPGSGAAGAADYVVQLLNALEVTPARLWAGLDGWIEPGVWERHAWSERIDGWRDAYDRLLAGNGTSADKRMAYEHACEAMYG